MQIAIAIAALEVLGASIQKYTAPGDLTFDPLGLKPEDEEELAALQVKEGGRDGRRNGGREGGRAGTQFLFLFSNHSLPSLPPSLTPYS